MIPAVRPAPDDGDDCDAVPPADAFAAAWLGELTPRTRATLGEVLDPIARALDEAWPDGPPHLESFWPELARCVPADVDEPHLAETISRMHAVELHLALACRLGHARALVRFEREHMSSLDAAIGRVDSTTAFIDETKQRIRTRLLVAQGNEPPKIAHYTGQGPLHTWMRVVAVREALSSVRAERRRAFASDEELLAIEASATGPELGALKQQYRDPFSDAFETALEQLEPAQRNLLRLHYLHGLSIDELAVLLRIHRSSAARRIVKTRELLLAGTRRSLQARLAIGRKDFEQLMGLVASRLDLSIERFLADRHDQAG
jgi:RNA polymerase sigma-70 factor, ECF subfamily